MNAQLNENHALEQAKSQVDMADQDMDIILTLSIPIEPRKEDRQDALIMLARTRAHGRGATPAEVEANVLAFIDQTEVQQ